MPDNDRIWLITGCSTGLGRALAEILIARGEKVVATARKPEMLESLVNGHANARAMKLDMTSSEDIARVVEQITAEWGAVDVLVNNAGYGYVSAIEEGDETLYRQLFETNFFGLVALTRAVLPGMRSRRNGHIINISSVGGIAAQAGTGYYAATKFAVVGFSEALAEEVAPLGIKVTVVAPGPFRTDWAGRSLQITNSKIDDYAGMMSKRVGDMSAKSGKQIGSPERAGEAILSIVESQNPPLHLVLGAPGLARVKKHFEKYTAEIGEWEPLTLSADYPAEE